jgi:hypothetical protein
MRGVYVDPYIAGSVNYDPTPVTNEVLRVVKFMNSSYFRPVYVNLNLGFQTYNLIRDFMAGWKLAKAGCPNGARVILEKPSA